MTEVNDGGIWPCVKPDEEGKAAIMKYVYEFSVWPAERGFCKAMYTLFDALNRRVAMEFTEQEFELFRESINQHGITLREIERVPYHLPEIVL